jgi:periplasmic copper chaperone A
MKRILPALGLLLLTGCQTLGLSDGEKTAVAPPSAEVTAPSAALSAAPQPTIAVAEAWAAPTPKGAKVAAGFLVVANGATTDDRLVGATSTRAKRVELHEMSQEGKTMKMRPVKDGIAVPAGGSVTLAQDGLHLMFTEIDKPFVVGDTIPVKLVFEKSGEVEIAVIVKKREVHANAH